MTRFSLFAASLIFDSCGIHAANVKLLHKDVYIKLALKGLTQIYIKFVAKLKYDAAVNWIDGREKLHIANMMSIFSESERPHVNDIKRYGI